MSSGNEALILGVEFQRYIRIGSGFFSYLSINGGLGTWLHGPAFWGGVKIYQGQSDWAPYTGLSAVLWNGEAAKTGVEYKADISALAIYMPLGLQFDGKSGFVFSFEIAVYLITSMSWEVQKEENRPKTTFAFGEDTSLSDIKFWGGLKVGFSF